MKNPFTSGSLVLVSSLAAGLVFSHPAWRGPAPVSRQPEIVTDKSEYEPGSTAYIAGSDFLPNELVVLQVVHADGSAAADHEPWGVQANWHGDFVSEWQVCEGDCVDSDLRLVAIGERSRLTATAKLTDGAQSSSIATPMASGGQSTAQLQGWFDLSQQWGGTIQSSNSKYTEGDTIPIRFNGSFAPGSTNNVILKFDFSSGGPQHFFDSFGSYNASIKNVNLLAGISSVSLSNVFVIPVDSSLTNGAQLPGLLTSYNITSLTFGNYSLVNGVKMLPVTFVVATGGGNGNKNVVLGYGGHLASANVWGANNGASVFPGASTKAYASLNGSPDLNVAVNPNGIVPSADLAMSKVASPEPVLSGANLTYTLTVVNNGPDAASAVIVKDTLPIGTSFISATTSQGTFSGTSSLTFSLGTLNAQATATMTILVKVTASTAGSLTNGASVSSTTLDSVTNNNASANVISTVLIPDTTPPVISCPSDILTNTFPGICSNVVTYIVTATDTQGPATVLCTPASGSIFVTGITTVNCKATDTSGNTSTCSFHVIVTDKEPPGVTCSTNIIARADLGSCSTVVNYSVGVSDNCSGASIVCTPASGTVFSKGTNTVTCIARDAIGNTSSCAFTVAVLDTQPPQIVCPANITTATDAGQCHATVSYTTPTATDNCPGVPTVVCVPSSGSAFPIGTNLVTCVATDAAGNSTNCFFTVTVTDSTNQSWPAAMTLNLSAPDSSGLQQAVVEQCITALDQSRWFKFQAQPGSRVIITLTDLPEDYDLVLFKDIAAAYSQLTSQDDLMHLSAEFAGDAFSPSAFSSDAFSPSAFSPSAFSPSAFSPSAFSPSAFSPSAFSPSAFSPSAFSPDAFAPSAFSPSAFSPSAFSPSAFSPSAFSPSAFSPSAFSAAQVQSILAVSAFDGVTSEGVVAETWDSTGNFYLRVRGRNGVFSTGNAFQLTVFQLTGVCGSVSPIALDGSGQPLPPSTTAAPQGGYKTLILTDLNRWLGAAPSATKTSISTKLQTLANRPEVGGVVVDVGSDPWVSFFNAQADVHFDCPFAKNLVAGAIKAIVDRSRVGNALQYVVLVGDDGVIPFFRYPDEALLGPESNYVPPVKDLTSSQASLRLDYVLGQDAYGAQCSLSLKDIQLPLPDLAVGRLVETAPQVSGMIDAYLGTANGVISTPHSSLVTGYDFLADDAQAVSNELALALAQVPDALICPNTSAPSLCWTANDLRTALFSNRHDIIFLAGHFSASETLAADYTTHMLASELSSSSIDFHNTVLFSAGCHSGYNVVSNDSILGVTLEPDWAQACALKQITLIAGTGYQYGDTDFIEYGERFYLELAQQMRTGPGPIPIGKAVLNAKHVYLAATPEMRGIHTKAYLESALFGLPMLRVDVPGTRRANDILTPIVPAPQPFSTDPGLTLGLTSADVAVVPTLTLTPVSVTDPDTGTQTTATYLAGGNGLINNPAEPILPLEVRNVSSPGTVLRGVGFRGATYTDLPGKVPLTGAPTTTIRGVHATFLSEVFYPMRPWSVNYFGALCGGLDGFTRLMAIPAQFKSDSPTSSTGTIRQFNEMDFRLFYNSNISTYVSNGVPSTPALAAAPAISGVLGITSADQSSVALSARVVGNPAAGIQAVWVTYTALSGPFAGKWQSVDLSMNGVDSTLWQGTLPLSGTSSQDVRYMVQAVNGVGVVALDTKLGSYHIPDEFDSANLGGSPTMVTLLSPPTTGAYGTTANLQALLALTNGTPLAGQRLVFSLGGQELWAFTDGSGKASAALPLRTTPGDYQIVASFRGAQGLAPSFTNAPFTVTRATTALTIAPTLVYSRPNVDTKMYATLTDGAGHNILERTFLFVLSNTAAAFPNPVLAKPITTDINGKGDLGPVGLPGGIYSVTAFFNGTIPVPTGQSINIDDGLFIPSTTAGILVATLIIDDSPPVLHCPGDITQNTSAGRCDAVVNYQVTVSDNNPSPTFSCSPTNGSVFVKGATAVNCTATDIAGNTSTCSFNVTVIDNEAPHITCSPNITTNAALGSCSTIVNYSTTATDNCAVKSLVCTPASGTAFAVGITNVNCIATDTSGNTATCSFTVTVRDTQAPVINCPAPITVKVEGQSTAVNYSVTATDNCSGATVICNPPSGTRFSVPSVTTVNCTATDASNNQSSCAFTITVQKKS